MKATFLLAIVAILSLLPPGRCWALMEIAEVSPQQAKAMGMDVRARPAGPDAAYIELEFEPEGELKQFTRVNLELRERDKLILSAPLHREEQSKPGHVRVGFTTERAQVDRITLVIVTGSPMNYTGHELRLKEFIDLKKLK